MGYYGKLWESTEIKGILGSLYGYPQAKNNATPPILTPLATPGSLSKTNCTRPEKGELKGADLVGKASSLGRIHTPSEVTIDTLRAGWQKAKTGQRT